jgi:hypothetical protein
MANTVKLYNISGSLINDVEIRNNSNGTAFAIARVQGEKRATTVLTYVKAGIAALQGRKAGESVRLFGTYVKSEQGQTFSAMGLSPERPAQA